MRGENSLMAYLCMIIHLCLAIEVQDIPGLEEIVEATKTTDLEMIQDVVNLMAK